MRKQWNIWLHLYGSEANADRRLYWYPSSIFKEDTLLQKEEHFSFKIKLNGEDKKFAEFQAMIYATGFGKPKRPIWAEDNQCDYWAWPPHAHADRTKDIAVFGSGDSALADAIELAVKIKGDRGEYSPLDQFELAKLMAT